MDNFYLSDPLIPPYEDWSNSTWYGLVNENGSYAQSYGDPVWPARMTGVDLATFCWTSHFDDPAGDFSFDMAVVTSTGDIVNIVFNCAYSYRYLQRTHHD